MGQEIKSLNYEPLEKSVANLSGKEIYYEAEPNNCEREAKVRLYWNKERAMWLANVFGKFLEGYSRGEQVFIDFSHDSQALNQSACIKLLEAYGINPSEVNLSEVPKLEPSRLEILAGMNRQEAAHNV